MGKPRQQAPKGKGQPSSSQMMTMQTRQRSRKEAEETSKQKRQKLISEQFSQTSTNDLIVDPLNNTQSPLSASNDESSRLAVKQEVKVEVSKTPTADMEYFTWESFGSAPFQPVQVKIENDTDSGHMEKYVVVKEEVDVPCEEHVNFFEKSTLKYAPENSELPVKLELEVKVEPCSDTTEIVENVSKELATSLPPSNVKIENGNDSQDSTSSTQVRQGRPNTLQDEDKNNLGICTNEMDKQPDGMLADPRILCLFQEVFRVLIHRGSNNSNGITNWRNQWSFISTCRLVCKSWKRSVDNLLETDPSHLSVPNSEIDLLTFKDHFTPCPAVLKYYGDRVNYHSKWGSSFLTSSKEKQRLDPSYNPIPTRHLKISIAGPWPFKNWNKFCQDVSDYLHAFGPQVWYLTVERKNAGGGLPQMFKWLSRWLQLLPNLKSVAFDIDSGAHGFSKTLERDMEQNRDPFDLPYLKDLVTFQITHENAFLYNLLRKNPHIGKLRMTTYKSSQVSVLMGIELENLSELSIVIGSKDHLQKLSSVSWKLRKLSLSFNSMEHCTLQEVMNVATKFKDTLESLSFDTSEYGIHGRLGENALDLPNLKHLRIKYNEDYATVLWENFLKELRQLETLELEVLRRHYLIPFLSDKTEVFWKCMSTIHEANYWSNYPRLRSVAINLKVDGEGNEKRFQFLRKRQGMQELNFDIVRIVP